MRFRPSEVPTCTFISVSLIVIFLMYSTKILNSLPCGNTFKDIFYSNFCHIDGVHLVSNLISLYAISTVEKKMGYKSFIWLVIFLLLLNTVLEYISRLVFNYKKCSIGFSGILFGLLTWDIISNKDINIEILVAIAVMVISPSIHGANSDTKVSLSGHMIGALSGILGALMWKQFVSKNE